MVGWPARNSKLAKYTPEATGCSDRPKVTTVGVQTQAEPRRRKRPARRAARPMDRSGGWSSRSRGNARRLRQIGGKLVHARRLAVRECQTCSACFAPSSSSSSRARALPRVRGLSAVSTTPSSMVMIGLTDSTLPIAARAGLIRPPRFRYSSVSSTTYSLTSSRRRSSSADDLGGRLSLLQPVPRAICASSVMPMLAVALSTMWTCACWSASTVAGDLGAGHRALTAWSRRRRRRSSSAPSANRRSKISRKRPAEPRPSSGKARRPRSARARSPCSTDRRRPCTPCRRT